MGASPVPPDRTAVSRKPRPPPPRVSAPYPVPATRESRDSAPEQTRKALQRTTPRCTRRMCPASRRSRRRRSSPRVRVEPLEYPRARVRRLVVHGDGAPRVAQRPTSRPRPQSAKEGRESGAMPRCRRRRRRRVLPRHLVTTRGDHCGERAEHPTRRIRPAVSGRAPARAYPRWPRTPPRGPEAARGVSARRVPCRTPRRRPRCERRPSPSRRRSSTPGFARVDPWRLERRAQPGARQAAKGRAREVDATRRVRVRPLLLLLSRRRLRRACRTP